jgi:hypothetical protein
LLLQGAGLGAVRPNTAVYGFLNRWKNRSRGEVEQFVGGLRDTLAFNANLIVVRGHHINYNVSPEGRFIDVWWLSEHDGGITVLVPYLLSQHPFWKETAAGNACLRLIVLMSASSTRDQQQAMKTRIETIMLKLRFADWLVVVETFSSTIDERTLIEYNNIHCKTQLDSQSDPLTSSRTRKWLSSAQTIKRVSVRARMVVMTMPRPSEHVDCYDYMSWLELLTEPLNCPSMLIRGTGINVLTDQ